MIAMQTLYVKRFCDGRVLRRRLTQKEAKVGINETRSAAEL
jgi:hypothetical protein